MTPTRSSVQGHLSPVGVCSFLLCFPNSKLLNIIVENSKKTVCSCFSEAYGFAAQNTLGSQTADAPRSTVVSSSWYACLPHIRALPFLSRGPHPPQHGKQWEESLPGVAKGPSMPKALVNSQVSVSGKRQAHMTSAPTHEATDTSNPTVWQEGARQWRATQASSKNKAVRKSVYSITPQNGHFHTSPCT